MTKRIITLLLALMIAVSAFAFPVSAAEAVYDVKDENVEIGDIDGDGNVGTVKDLVYLARYLDGWSDYQDIHVKAADLNGDGLYATLADMFYLERYLAKWNGYTFGVSTDDDGAVSTTMGTTLPIFARFDFGKNTKAENQNYTSHAYIINTMSYNSKNIAVEFTDDSIIITALADYGDDLVQDEEFGWKLANTDRYSFSLMFDDIITYDFDDVGLVPGYGTWRNAPYCEPTANTAWVGLHQYMQVRMRNFTDNNIMSVSFAKTIGGYFTTQSASGLYLQGGEPVLPGQTGKKAKINTDWKVYTYDMNFQSHIARNLQGSYANMVESVVTQPNGCGSNNWNWFAGASVVGLRFDFLGAQSRSNYVDDDYYLVDTRTNITKGDKVEVDYVIFGSTIEQLDEYKSYAEESSLYGKYDPAQTEKDTTSSDATEATTTVTEYVTEIITTATSLDPVEKPDF